MEYRYVEHLGIPFYVNQDGEVYGYLKSKDKYVKRTPHLSADGYLVVTGYSSKTKHSRSIGVHILVAKAFIPNPNNLPEVNHKDFNRQNPKVDNLEWISHSDNVGYSRKAGRYPSQVGELNPNFGNRTLSKRYSENKQLAKEKQSRPLGKNGRAKKCKLYCEESFIGEFSCQREAVYFLFDSEKLNRVKSPERIIKKLKNPEGYCGYKLIV